MKVRYQHRPRALGRQTRGPDNRGLGPDRRSLAPDREAAALGRQAGSVLILVLFACLAVAVSIQALSTVILCAQGAVVDESAGRGLLAERDAALAVLRQRALASWESIPRTVVRAEPNAVEGSVSQLPGGGDWVLDATVRHAPEVSRLVTSGWLEKGRDGLDLPLAALVAGALAVAAGRESPWLELETSGMSGASGAGTDVAAEGYVRVLPSEPLLGEGCSLVGLEDPWRLDPGWRRLGAETVIHDDTGSSEDPAVLGEAGSVAAGSGVTVITGRTGQTAFLPADCGGQAPGSPCLILVTGGMTLDARTRGDLYGVIVVDDGDVLLQDTTVHGAVFATGTIDMGETGRLLFSRSILRWATDRSLNRVRLVPGTREEGME